MDAQTLEKERVRLMVMLEKDAQKRLAVIEKAEKNKGGSDRCSMPRLFVQG
ncbi:MAG: hypothetical protein V8R75_02625 [Oscillospiraceae bacterium]